MNPQTELIDQLVRHLNRHRQNGDIYTVHEITEALRAANLSLYSHDHERQETAASS